MYCSLTYVTVDDAIVKILESGPNTLLAKFDIKHAFRLLPIHPADRHLLTMEWNQSIYIGTCLPFALRSAPKLFNILADLLSWITTQRGVTFFMHYLDDFLLLGPPDSSICQHNLDIFTQVCDELGIPLETDESCQKWENLCGTNVQYCCKAKRVDIFYQTEQRLSFRPLLVVHFHW